MTEDIFSELPYSKKSSFMAMFFLTKKKIFKYSYVSRTMLHPLKDSISFISQFSARIAGKLRISR